MFRQYHVIARAAGCALVTLLGFAAAASAQEPASPAPEASAASERRLRDAVLARYKVLPIQNGIILVPLSRIEGVDNVELRDGTVAINGRPVTGGEVRERLGRGADPVLELSYLDLAAQRRILLRPEPARAAQEAEDTTAARQPGAAEPPRPLEPIEPDSPTRSFTRNVEARVRVGGNITVPEDERVTGAVVAVAGSVTVNGLVEQDVVAVAGNIHLGRRSEVRGDVVVVGGTVDREPGAVVRGKVSEVAFAVPAVRVRPGWDFDPERWFESASWRAVRLFGSLLRMTLFALLAVVLVLLVPRAVGRVEVAVVTQPWKSALVGLLAQLFFVPVLVIVVVVLAVSIIGIPLLLLVPFGVLAFVVALVLGLTGAATAIARLVRPRSSWTTSTSLARLLVGLAMIWGITVLGRLIGLGGGPLAVIGTVLLFAGFVVEYAAWTVGLGGALLTRFGRRGDVLTTAPPIPPTPADPFAEGEAAV